jgi:hypothetical protein
MDGTVRGDRRNERASAARYNGSMRRARATLLLPLAVALAIAGSSCGSGDHDPQPAATSTSPEDATARHDRAPRHEAGHPGEGPSHHDRGHADEGDESVRGAVRAAVAESEVARLEGEERDVARVVRAYVGALDHRDGERVCSLFAPGALARIDLPRDRGGCGASLTASIGYRDPRGFPVYSGSRVARIPAVAIDGSSARVTATTVTRFAGSREPSVEDDLVYLTERSGRWVIAKPSANLYRAIGVGDIPPSVLAPPQRLG